MKTIVFHCDGHSGVGMGHLRRCLELSKLCQESGKLKPIFSGTYSEHATELIRTNNNEINTGSFETCKKHDIAVVDLMADEEEPDRYDTLRIATIAKQATIVILITSALTVPNDLPIDIAIGHMIQDTSARPYKLYAGLKYAPVAPQAYSLKPEKVKTPDRIRNILIAFGAYPSAIAPLKTLGIIKKTARSYKIEHLISPSHKPYMAEIQQAATGMDYTHHINVPDLTKLFLEADAVIASYGHMTFDVLSHKKHFFNVATKPFQLSYAKQLHKTGLVHNLGMTTQINSDSFNRLIEHIENQPEKDPSQSDCIQIDEKGYQRIIEIILSV